MERNVMLWSELEEFIENDNPVVFLDHTGDKVTEFAVLEQLKEGWHVGVVTMPAGNAVAEIWCVATSNHKDHYGFDAGEVMEKVVQYEEREYAAFTDEWRDSGGMIFELEEGND